MRRNTRRKRWGAGGGGGGLREGNVFHCLRTSALRPILRATFQNLAWQICAVTVFVCYTVFCIVGVRATSSLFSPWVPESSNIKSKGKHFFPRPS